MTFGLSMLLLGAMMNAKEFDQFYTSDDVAASCIEKVRGVLPRIGIKDRDVFYLEPSAGDGAFLRAIEKVDPARKLLVFGCDIDPKRDDILKRDFLSDSIADHLPTGKVVVSVGNPPFGRKGKLASAFINKAFEYSQVVCFVLPIQFNKYSGHNQVVPQAKLVFNEPLPDGCFVFNGKPYSVRSCFQVWTTRETQMPDLRIRQSPRTKHPDFEMYQYNCTEEAAKFFDKSKYPWDFAVPRQGFKDYGMRETDSSALDRRVQWIFFKAKNRNVLSRLKRLDFEALSRKNSTIPGFGKADVVEEYERLYPVSKTNEVIQAEFEL